MLSIFCLLLSGCFQRGQNSKEEEDVPSSPNSDRKSPIESPQNPISPIDELLDKLTVEEKVGQLMVIGLEGKKYSPELDDMIRNYHVGGLILLGRNVSTAPRIQEILNDSKKANENNQIALLLSVDEEGGRVSRLPAGFEKLPSAAKVGKRNDESFNYRTGMYVAELLHGFGYNMNYAPVLDVNSNPKNPVIGDRSYGADPNQVANLGISTMRGMMDTGIIPVIKHFPGHGDTSIDSHKSLPIVEKDLYALHQEELIPFQRAIDEGADAVLVGHILFPAIDPVYPASMSKVIITDVLRDEMKFQGVVITDDLTMGAITNDLPIAKAALQAFVAGSDLLMVVGDHQNQVETIQLLLKAVSEGVISEDRLDESVKRILMLKDKYKLTDDVSQSVDALRMNKLYKKYIEDK